MIAIPMHTKDATTLCDLYGKAPYFALLDETSGVFSVVENATQGEGPKCAKFLKSLGVDSTIFYHMGEGVYRAFEQHAISVYTAQHRYVSIDEIFINWGRFTQLDSTNFNELLDPGEGQSCQCGCH
ncbi:MAG: hypothetical protein KU38_10815 [Sulfurovum sp. FS08-3]|nr:MAG: hypothetical protein KU38_10815 [Sulfurovum sp. FS08-3]